MRVDVLGLAGVALGLVPEGVGAQHPLGILHALRTAAADSLSDGRGVAADGMCAALYGGLWGMRRVRRHRETSCRRDGEPSCLLLVVMVIRCPTAADFSGVSADTTKQRVCRRTSSAWRKPRGKGASHRC